VAKTPATKMKIRNRKGRIHAAFSAFDTPPRPFGSANFSLPRSLVFLAQINLLDKYCLALSERQNLASPLRKQGPIRRGLPFWHGVCTFGSNQGRWLWVLAFARTTNV